MKTMRRTVGIILTVIMLAAMVVPYVSAANDALDIPIVDIRGFMSYTVYEDKDDLESEKAFPPSTGKIVEAVAKLAPALGILALNNDWDAFGDVFIPALNDMLGDLCFDENGEAQYNTGVHLVYPTKEQVEKELFIDFDYDWRDDPFTSAAKLNDLVNYLTDDLGYGKVALECHSYGGVVMLTYLSEYGTEKIHSCSFNASAVYGAQFAGQLVKGNVDIAPEALTEFLKGLFSHNDYELLLDVLSDTLMTAGVTEFITDFVADLFDKLSDRIWTESILPVFGNWPSIWALVPDEDFEAGYRNVFENLYAGSDKDFSGLKAKIERYNTEIKQNREAILNEINDNTNLYVIARYGYSGVPLGDIWVANTDTVLNTSVESFGATCKNYSEASKDTVDEKYISPDGTVDASTCLFPEQTWFIRDCKHTQREDSVKAFSRALLSSKEQATIDTFSEYPQFLVFNAADMSVIPDDNGTYVKDTFINRIVSFLKSLFSALRNFLDKIIK